jgi:hypothetical protein
VKFSTLYTGANYIPPAKAETNGDGNGVGPHKPAPDLIRVHRFTAAPTLNGVKTA